MTRDENMEAADLFYEDTRPDVPWPTVTIRRQHGTGSMGLGYHRYVLDTVSDDVRSGEYALVPIGAATDRMWFHYYPASKRNPHVDWHEHKDCSGHLHRGCGWKQLVDLPEGSGK